MNKAQFKELKEEVAELRISLQTMNRTLGGLRDVVDGLLKVIQGDVEARGGYREKTYNHFDPYEEMRRRAEDDMYQRARESWYRSYGPPPFVRDDVKIKTPPFEYEKVVKKGRKVGAQKFHPDSGKETASEENMKKTNEAADWILWKCGAKKGSGNPKVRRPEDLFIRQVLVDGDATINMMKEMGV